MKKSSLIRVMLTVSVFPGLFILMHIPASATLNVASISSMSVKAAANGAALYGSKCSICHGQNGAGTPAWRAKGQPDLTNSGWQRSRSDEQLAAAIRDGKGKSMPPFKQKLSDEDIVALVQRVRAFAK
jgi:mono/diheme cytochrome c family protein